MDAGTHPAAALTTGNVSLQNDFTSRKDVPKMDSNTNPSSDVLQSHDHAKLSAEDRTAIYEILAGTKKGLPDYWR